jgi:hypothetical protein
VTPPHPQTRPAISAFGPASNIAAPAQRVGVDRTSPIVAVVALLTAAMFTNSAIAISQANRASMLLVEYAAWIAAALLMRKRLPSLVGSGRVVSPMRYAMVALLLALATSTILLWHSGLRPDMDRLLPQIAALAFMSLPFFIFDVTARVTEMDRPLLITCHLILLISMTSILGDVTGLTNFEHRGGRYFGFLGDAVAWALTLPFLVYFSSNRLVLAAVTGFGIALTGSRAPVICVTAALLMLFAFSRGRRTQYLITLFLLVVLILYKSDVFETFASRMEATSLSSNDRLATAMLGWRIFRMSPYFGSGYNSLTHLFPYRFGSSMYNALGAQTSTFMQMLSDGGIILFVGYFAFVFASTISGIRLMRRSRTVVQSGMVNGIAAWLLSMLWVNQSATWFLVGSYIGPLVLAVAGMVSGYNSRLMIMRAYERRSTAHG